LGDGVSVDEGNEAKVVLVREGGTDGVLTVEIAIAGNATNGEDYTLPQNIKLAWAASEGGEKTLSIPINKDSSIDPDETIELFLRAPGSEATSSRFIITIIDKTAEPPKGSAQFSSSNYNAEEGKEAIVELARTGDTGAALSARIEINDGTVVKGVDYDLPPDEQLKLSWLAGDNGSRQVRIPIKPDGDIDSDETIILKLFDVNNVEIGNASVKIIDVSAQLGCAQFSATSFDAEEGKEAVVMVNRTGDTAAALSAEVALSNGTASKDGLPRPGPAARHC
jgi:hypothetical protein